MPLRSPGANPISEVPQAPSFCDTPPPLPARAPRLPRHLARPHLRPPRALSRDACTCGVEPLYSRSPPACHPPVDRRLRIEVHWCASIRAQADLSCPRSRQPIFPPRMGYRGCVAHSSAGTRTRPIALPYPFSLFLSSPFALECSSRYTWSGAPPPCPSVCGLCAHDGLL
jgi:hypothetical protein